MGKLGEEEDELATEQKRKYTDLGDREEQVTCHVSVFALEMTDEACQEAELMIVITSVSSSKNLTSFNNCFFHFSGSPGFRMRLIWPKGMEDLAAFGAREVKKAAAE